MTVHDKFVTNSCNHSGQPRKIFPDLKSSKNVLLYRIQFCGFSNAWHPFIPSHHQHWGSNFRVHRMASNCGLLTYGLAGAFGRQVLQGFDRRWAYYQIQKMTSWNSQLWYGSMIFKKHLCSLLLFASLILTWYSYMILFLYAHSNFLGLL